MRSSLVTEKKKGEKKHLSSRFRHALYNNATVIALITANHAGVFINASRRKILWKPENPDDLPRCLVTTRPSPTIYSAEVDGLLSARIDERPAATSTSGNNAELPSRMAETAGDNVTWDLEVRERDDRNNSH